jgi:hypothetical protein
MPSEGAALIRALPVHKVPLLGGKLGKSVQAFVRSASGEPLVEDKV